MLPFGIVAWLAVFTVSAAVVLLAGVRLLDATEVIDRQLQLGSALGGAILLAVTTNLPEIAIMVSAGLKGNIGVITGNLLGGVAIQTLLLALFDSRIKQLPPLTCRASSSNLALEGLLVLMVLNICIMGIELPASLILGRITPASLLITLFWMAGLWILGKMRLTGSGAAGKIGLDKDSFAALPVGQSGQEGNDSGNEAEGESADEGTSRPSPEVWRKFAGAAVVTLMAGAALEWSGEAIAKEIHMDGVLFGATFLAFASALPEISTGLRAIRKGDYELAVSDIFGGNAFLPVLFLPATIITGAAVLPSAGKTDIYLAALAGAMTCVYLAGLVTRSEYRILGVGIDSVIAVALYLTGMAGLFMIS
ncbi:MAG: sodium:calcium antiporter [Gemmatimonadota bacterium]|jgi:cation:H+ antiporter|nr:sodium:calcium antiporter [Gemmatimonadota bacterium]